MKNALVARVVSYGFSSVSKGFLLGSLLQLWLIDRTPKEGYCDTCFVFRGSHLGEACPA